MRMEIEATIRDAWYPVAVVEDLKEGVRYHTRLLGQDIEYGRDDEGSFFARREGGDACRVQTCYHTHWVSLGEPAEAFFAVPEFSEPDRRILGAGSMRVHVSGLRAIENFLDMAHFPYVHTGYLGEEPHTDVAPYSVEFDRDTDEIYARECRFYQPRAASASTAGIDTDYIYRVASPFVAILYKTSPPQPTRRDVICLFVQPVEEDWCIAHTVLAYLDDISSDQDLRQFQQTIFGQDLMILSNHMPRTLPLGTRLEVPTRADAMSAAYRRWLLQKGISYGTYQAH
ncbi:phenylpropionate dioxygenase-like ring-hydroxylating dioxygenase large terminal subunit [Cupriavidus alkaliphilus]|nr:phenylpropionate dioxygenase-like ring-hydroxylating dioxygenase large terminal subunit [Cupriavidus alkaliphilus]